MAEHRFERAGLFRLPLHALALWSVCAIAAAQNQPLTSTQTISGALAVEPAPDGTVYVAGVPGRFPPTSGAWMTECLLWFDRLPTLSKIDLTTDRVLWTTCIPFRNSLGVRLTVDPQTGAPVIAGSPARDFATTAGAVNEPRITVGVHGEEIGIVRLEPDGTAPQMAALIASTASVLDYPRVFDNVRGVALLPDDSVVVVARAAAPDLPVTDNAIAKQRDAATLSGYLVQLSKDGSQILYGTYWNGIGDITEVIAAGTTVFLTGTAPVTSDSRAGLPLPETPRAERLRSFAASLDLATSVLRYFTPIEAEADHAGPRIASLPDGRLLIAAGARSPHPALLIFELSTAGDSIHNFHRILGADGPVSMQLTPDGTVVVGMNGSQSPPLVTAASPRRPYLFGQSTVIGLDAGTGRVLFSAILEANASINDLALANDRILTGVNSSYTEILGQPEPLRVAGAGKTPLFFAYPNRYEQCSPYTPAAALLWDLPDAGASDLIEVRKDTPDGPVLATGTTGVIPIAHGNTKYFLTLDPRGGPFASPRVLATEETSLVRPVRCSAVAEPKGYLAIVPNPVLSCSATPWLGTQTLLSGYADLELLTEPVRETQIRIGGSEGTLFVAAPGSSVGYETGDWVRNGMDFFLTSPTLGGAALASQRAYLLPVRNCSQPDAKPPAAIRATRDCMKTDTFTLAFHTGELIPIEIREDSPAGKTVARLPGEAGLVDVTTTRRAVYHLMKFEAGEWKSIASTTADPSQRCEQGLSR